MTHNGIPVKILTPVSISLSVFLLFLTLRMWFSNSSFPFNIIGSTHISWGKAWSGRRSTYGGSEFRFTIQNSKRISIRASSPNNEPGLGIEMDIDGKKFTLATPNLEQQELSINFEKSTVSLRHFIRVRHYCSGSYSPCDITI